MAQFLKHYKQKFKMFRDLLGRENPSIVEIGAHYGEDSMRFIETFPKCTVYCFEPDPRNLYVFKKYINHERVLLYECALSNTEGELDFYVSHDYNSDKVPEKYDWISLEDYRDKKLSNSGSSSLKKGYINNVGKISVKARRFDNWYNEVNPGKIDLAWIDVQGAEKDVIEGMGETIKNIKFIWVEYGERFYQGAMSRSETINFLNSLGFQPIDNISDKSPQGDILFKNTGPDI